MLAANWHAVRFLIRRPRGLARKTIGCMLTCLPPTTFMLCSVMINMFQQWTGINAVSSC